MTASPVSIMATDCPWSSLSLPFHSCHWNEKFKEKPMRALLAAVAVMALSAVPKSATIHCGNVV
jgi:hypothetical protein